MSVVYAGDETCPSREEFLRNVRRYTTKWREVRASADARTFRVVLEERGAEHLGTLSIEMPEGGTTRREMAAADCKRAARGLAVVMALAIDPEANVWLVGDEGATLRYAASASKPPR